MWRQLGRVAMIMPHWGWTVLTVGCVLWLTLWPDPLPESDMTLFEGADKVVHSLMFFGVYLSACYDISRRKCINMPDKVAGVLVRINLCGWVMLLGAVIELLQPLSGRSCELADFIADAVGAVTGLAVSGYVIRRLCS